MEDPEAKICPNCKREIPSVNFMTHSVHCARNIRVCPVCKEPVPQAELQEHHDTLHKLLPCKKCGESVCGTDLDDHVRDSCALTIKSCRFCELELPRRDLPAHEGYCGVRTEQCPECGEWVMIKYRQLHLDSNHGFLRLDDDPAPLPKRDALKITNLTKPMITKITNLPSTRIGLARPTTSDGLAGPSTTSGMTGPSTSNGQTRPTTSEGLAGPSKTSGMTRPSTSNGLTRPTTSDGLYRPSTSKLDNASQTNAYTRNLINDKPTTEMRYFGGSSNTGGTPNVSSNAINEGASGSWRTQPSLQNGIKAPLKRTNDKPQINTDVAATKKVEKNLSISRGAVKKRPAPRPPVSAAVEPALPLPPPLQAALQRQQREDRERQQQTAYNLSVDLPPVLSAAAKLEKLRKMDALQNPPDASVDYKSRLQGRVWQSPNQEHAGYVLGTPDNEDSHRRRREDGGGSGEDYERRREEFKNLKPMTPQEFMERFNKMQLRKDAEGNARSGDRFSEIKSSLRELRRGLNEVTAPYNLNSNAVSTGNTRVGGRRSAVAPPGPEPAAADGGGAVRLPCEFCDTLVPADDLVQHQTGCRPDLAQFRSGRGIASAVNNMEDVAMGNMGNENEPVIPCEFCMESLPVYLISEHQERCGRDSNLLYAD